MIVSDGQNIFDLTLQSFGNLELLFDEVIIPNNLSVNYDLKGGQVVYINPSGKGNEEVKKYITQNNLEINNGLIILESIIEEELAIQWPVFVDILEAININKRIKAVE